MRKALEITTISVVLFVTGLWLFGCGSGDILDENNQRYRASMSLQDGGNDDYLTIDIYQNPDCDGEANTTDPEFYTDVLADITVSVDSGAPGITLNHYRIEYIPLLSSDGLGNAILPPELVEPEDGAYIVSVTSGGTGTFTITLLSVDVKEEFYNWWITSTVDVARYEMRVTLYFTDEYLEDREIEVTRTVFLGNYDNC